MQGENITSDQEALDSLAGWKSGSSFILALTMVLIIGSISGSMLYSLLLFFPFLGIFGGLFNNNMLKVYSGTLCLIAYPLIRMIALAVCGIIFAAGGAKMTAESANFLKFIIAAVIYFSCMPLSSLGASALPENKLPVNVYKGLQITGFFLALISAVLLVCIGMSFCNRRFLHIPPGFCILVVLVVLALSICGAIKMVKKVLACEYSEDNNKSGRLKKQSGLPTLADVAGMEEVKKQLKLRLIDPVVNPKMAAKYGLKPGGGVMLYGPPGTGKTFLARAVAGELGLPFYMFTGADIFGKYVGEAEKNISAIFAEARKNPLSVVFVDEMETIFSKRSEDIHEVTRKVISVILQELDGVDKSKNPILLLGATNVPWMIDEAFMRPGRFDILTYVGLPDRAARMHILQNALSKGGLPLEAGLVEYMADNTEQYSGADLTGVVEKMRQSAFENRSEYYSSEQAYNVLCNTHPSGNQKIIEQIRHWESERFNIASDDMRLQNKTGVKLAHVAGMENVKEQLRLRLIEPLRNPELAARYGLKAGGGVMLYGPPGTGKTFLARAVAGELDLPFYVITGADIFGKYVGEAETNIRNIFANARKNPLSVVFFDEMETIFSSRSENIHESTQKVISIILQELDGVDKSKNPILLLGATNVPWKIDEAFMRPGRFDILAYVGLPERAARYQIIRNAFKQGNLPCEKGLLDYIAENTEFYSGADLEGLVNKIRQKAFDNRDSYYSMNLAYQIMLKNAPSNHNAAIEKIRQWEKSR